MTRPEGETRRDRRLQRIVGLGAVIALFSLVGNVVLTYNSIERNDRNHAVTATLQQTIIAKDKETITLLKEHSVTFAQQKKQAAAAAAYDQDVKILAAELVGQNAAICAATLAACPQLPPLP